MTAHVGVDEQVTSILAVADDRAIVYRTGLAIGLKRGELEALVWATCI